MSHKLFAPLETNNDLKLDYPELAEVKEFANLTKSQLLFVWYHSNRTSPYYEWRKRYNNIEKRKIQACITESGIDKVASPEEVNRLLNKNFDSELKAAMDRMEQYQPAFRLRAKMLQERMFNQIEKIVDSTEAQMDEDGIDSDKRKQAIDILASANKQLQPLLESIEGSFGIRELGNEHDGKKKGQKLFDMVMSEEDID